ncbi:response regulator [Zhouia sp. PK063]|uniref:response regulator n=1 Tax=Zhouia sp. PK063 TaxID=3373602 RepID=UPI003799EABC
MKIVLILLFYSFSLGLHAQSELVVKDKSPSTEALRDSINNSLEKAYYEKNKANFKEANLEAHIALTLSDRLDDKEYQIRCYNFLAQLFLEYKNIKQASLILQYSESIINDSKVYISGTTENWMIYALLFARSNQPEKALEYLEKSKSKFNLEKEAYLARSHFIEGLVLESLGKFKEAKADFEKLIPVKDPFEPKYTEGIILYHIASIYESQGETNNAKLNALKALDIGKNETFPKIIIISDKLLAKIAQSNNDYYNAYNYLVEAEHYQTDYYINQPENEISQNSKAVNNNFEQFTDRFVEHLQQQIKEKNQTVNIAKLTSILSSALLIIISLLTISLYRNNQIKFKTNDLLVRKNVELQIAKEEAEKAMQAKGQFLSTVSHELRTPLYAVTGLTHLLLEEDPKESQKEHLKSLKFSGEYLLNFINDILQLNKIEANKLSLKNVNFYLEKVLSEVVNSLQQTAKENHNTIILDIDKNIPKQLIGDPLKISQIFINLVGNALKFTENGEVIVLARKMTSENDKTKVHFEVKDNGIGISKEMQESIFESFSQGSTQINRKYGGTGLGLAIVKSLLSLFNSNITLESELGEGSTFMFDVVFDNAHAPHMQISQDETTPNTMQKVEDDFYKNLHILLVEDNKINQVITKKMLAKKDITCDIANDGYEAIEHAKKNKYDAILMDIHMPGISGLKATQEIRKFNNAIPIIALTAISLDENPDEFYQAGCNDVLTKPFKPDLFYLKIAENIINKNRENTLA